jgi:hypothetical protein
MNKLSPSSSPFRKIELDDARAALSVVRAGSAALALAARLIEATLPRLQAASNSAVQMG